MDVIQTVKLFFSFYMLSLLLLLFLSKVFFFKVDVFQRLELWNSLAKFERDQKKYKMDTQLSGGISNPFFFEMKSHKKINNLCNQDRAGRILILSFYLERHFYLFPTRTCAKREVERKLGIKSTSLVYYLNGDRQIPDHVIHYIISSPCPFHPSQYGESHISCPHFFSSANRRLFFNNKTK